MGHPLDESAYRQSVRVFDLSTSPCCIPASRPTVFSARTKTSAPFPAFGKERGVTLATSYFRVTYRDTIIGAAAFHFRVRNGNGWCHCAGITRRLEGLAFDFRLQLSPEFLVMMGRPLLVGRTCHRRRCCLKNRFTGSLTSAYRSSFRNLRFC